MLYVVADLEDPRWLVYLLEEFCRINKAEFPIQVTSKEGRDSSVCVIKYSNKPSGAVCIPNRSHIQPDGKAEKLSNEIFVLKGTTVNDAGFSLAYDLFWNAFVFLTRLEEYLSENAGRRIHSYSFNHPRQNKSTFEVPVVNHLFDELEGLIKNNFQNLPFKEKRELVIDYSHDVDYIRKTPQLRLKQTVFNSFNMLKNITRPSRFAGKMKNTASFIFSNPSYWCFDYWKDLEKNANVRSVFYVYAQAKRKNLRSWLFDPSYDITKNARLKEKLQELLNEGFEVGLHGSFNSAANQEQLSEEKSILEQIIGTEVQKVRQHWLRYFENVTPYIHNGLFRYDSSLGWNDRIGFRSGVATQYRPYDHINQRPFDYMVTPQVIMDAHIFEYASRSVEYSTQKAIGLLEYLQQLKCTHVSVCWHQRVCNSDYGWHTSYENILGV